MKKFCVLIVFTLLIFACEIDKKTVYVHGGYQFKIIDQYSVCFCGWTENAIEKSGEIYFSVPEKIYGLNVVRIEEGEINGFLKVRSIILHSGIKSIGEDVFYLRELEKIVFSEGLEVIEKRSFKDCHLEILTLPEGLKTIGEEAFADCYNLEKISLPKSLKIIEEGVFQSCKKLKDVSFQEGLKIIRASAFKDTSLDSITFPKSLERIEEDAFCTYGIISSIRKITFQDPSNWYVKKDDNSPWQSIDVSDPHINAENLVNKYSSYIWEKRP